MESDGALKEKVKDDVHDLALPRAEGSKGKFPSVDAVPDLLIPSIEDQQALRRQKLSECLLEGQGRTLKIEIHMRVALLLQFPRALCDFRGLAPHLSNSEFWVSCQRSLNLPKP